MANDTPDVTMRSPGGKTWKVPRVNMAKAKAMGWTEVSAKEPEVKKESLFSVFGRETALGAFSGLGIPESQSPIKDLLKSMAQPPSPKDPGTYLGPAYGIAKGLFGSAGELAEGAGASAEHPTSFGPVDVGKLGHGLGSLATQLLMLRGATKAGTTPLSEGEIAKGISKAKNVIPEAQMNVEDYLHREGLTAQWHLNNTVNTVRKNISAVAEKVSKQVDSAHPEGAIDATAITKGIEDDLKQIVKLPEPKIPTAIQKITEGPKAGTSTGPRVMGQHLDLSNPRDLAFFNKIKSSLTPQEVKRMEGSLPKGRWSFEQAKQTRSEVRIARDSPSLQGPMKRVANEAYTRLTNALKQAAQENGVLKDWEYYNKLNKNLEDRLEGKLGEMLKAESGIEVAKKMTENPAFTRELLRDFAKYGADVKGLSTFAKYAENMQHHLSRGLIRQWPAAILGGYLGKITGIPWAEAAIAGGYGTPLYKLLRDAARARGSEWGGPGEEVMRERELPPPQKE